MKSNENAAKLREWLAQETLDPPVRAELSALYERYEKNPEDAETLDAIGDRFYTEMVFGTAGMRGVMGAGPNRMSVHTVRKIAQGYAESLLADAAETGGEASVVIAYDNRRDSDLYALESACVFAANGVKTYLFDVLSATPLLSFAVRLLGTSGGVVVTASHNNKSYNGYKIYDSHGCQCMPDEAGRVAARIAAVDMWAGPKTRIAGYGKRTDAVSERAREAVAGEPLIEIVPHSVIEAYIAEVVRESKTPGALHGLNAVYTPLNGAGNKLVRAILDSMEIGSLAVVKEQEEPDPDFTTCPEPNPEKPEALKLALALAEKLAGEGEQVDIILGTDPDADRLGAMVRHGDAFIRLSGNQVGVLILDYVIRMREAAGSMPAKPVFITTIVSTPITGKMAEKHGIETRRVLTGFKFIGDRMNILEAAGEDSRYIFGFEESCGYLTGTYARDKDAQNATLMLCETAGLLKKDGKTLIDRLEELYEEYGYYLDAVDELVRPGEKGMHEIKAIMEFFRKESTIDIFSAGVTARVDYLSGERTDYREDGPVRSRIEDIPPSDVMEFELADGCKVLARPSGTEPKLKIYYAGVGATEEEAGGKIAAMQKEISAAV